MKNIPTPSLLNIGSFGYGFRNFHRAAIVPLLTLFAWFLLPTTGKIIKYTTSKNVFEGQSIGIFIFLLYLIFWIANIVMLSFYLKHTYRDPSISFTNFYKHIPLKYLCKCIIANMIYYGVFLLGLLLLIAPGLIWLYKSRYYLCFILDQDAPLFDSFKMSFHLTKGQGFEVFLWSATWRIIEFFAQFLLFLPLVFVVWPAYWASEVYVYRTLLSFKEEYTTN